MPPYSKICFTALIATFVGSSLGIIIHPGTRQFAKIFIPMFAGSSIVGYFGTLVAGAYGFLELPLHQE
uniref:Uncharacterized protein n=1 Tax=Panagrolaimus davidi TaxID=227884 RepID=A0A914QMT2_9BILA